VVDPMGNLDDAVALAPPPGAIVQSATIGFRVIYLVTLLLSVLWLGSNFRIISSDDQAVVLRFGRVVREQKAGLLLAWPRPIEEVRLLPGPARQLSRRVGALPSLDGIQQASSSPDDNNTMPPSATPYLTGDGKVVLLDATLNYRITDPVAFVLSQSHVAPAMDRIFRAAAVRITAGEGLNDFLVAQSTQNANAEQSVDAARARVREQLLSEVNGRLRNLSAEGASLGIEVDRIDLTAWLPPKAKLVFDSVLIAGQKADQAVAAANTAAELRRQGAGREADRIVRAAQAAATEQVVAATVNTANIVAIERAPKSARIGLMQQAYRDGIGGVLNKAKSVVVIDPHSGRRTFMALPAGSTAKPGQ
jgi:regulator of protease activity HflC (stomatin/prohibitin superfamily)